jgi:hypothetical protein
MRAFGTVQTPPVHAAGDWQPGLLVAPQLAPSAAAAWHVPEVDVVIEQEPPAEQVVAAPLITPHGWPAEATEAFAHWLFAPQ